MTFEASLYGSDNQRGANWHPTRAFHMLRGEALAWIYALILLETLQAVHEALEAGATKELLLQGKHGMNDCLMLIVIFLAYHVVHAGYRLSVQARQADIQDA